MKWNIFESVGNLLNKTQSGNTENKTQDDNITNIAQSNNETGRKSKDSKSVEKDSINKHKNLLKTILSTLNSFYKGQEYYFEDKELGIWITDNLLYLSVVDSDFKLQLSQLIANELGSSFHRIFISGEDAPNKATEIAPEVFLLINTSNKKSIARKAVITIADGAGSLLKRKYTIDAKQMQTKYNNRCNIGVGNFIQLDDKTFRENYIAIDDSTKSPQYKYNKYVSRAHAYISFDEERGFCLHVERGGTRNAQKRTHIYRNGETIELNNTLISEVLHDGDRIILSKSVHLLFKEL